MQGIPGPTAILLAVTKQARKLINRASLEHLGTMGTILPNAKLMADWGWVYTITKTCITLWYIIV